MSTSPQKVIVAVHGIGDQTRYATVQQVLAQFARYHGETAAVPLGNFYAKGEEPKVFKPREPVAISDLGFAEVYWAHIPRKVVDEKYILEDTEPWVKTIIGRIHQRQTRGPLPPGAVPLTPADERMIEEVLGEMLETIGVLDRLCFLADKMGLFSFDLKKVLVDFLDDVQIVAEFRKHGGEIGEVFAAQMQAIYEEFKGAEEIYLVAHSEGTVVTLLGLLSALCSEGNPWISKVRGLMTIGSPIDKHLILWPELFEEFQKPGATAPQVQPIEWHNYYDYGDPVGFELDTARKRLTEGAWAGVFDFPPDHDHGFARYPLPGKAHNDYWKDEDVFGHFLRHVVYKNPPKPGDERFEEPPRSKPLPRAVSWGLPYLIAVALLFCAVFVLYKAVHAYIDPESEDGILSVFATVGSITSLLAGLTVLARIPRLSRLKRWWLFGFVFFLASLAGARFFSCLPAGGGVAGWWSCAITPTGFDLQLLLGALVLAPVIGLCSRAFPHWGMRTLLIPGGLAVAYFVIRQIQGADGDLWPVFLAGAVFLYLWWLVALLFDLTFVWHRYIRFSVSVLEYPKPAAAKGGAVAFNPARPAGGRGSTASAP
jgi:hypothetical protein